MPQPSAARQQQILAWLDESQSLTIDELVERLGISVMTVHRDLDRLVRDGYVEKVYGGVMLAGQFSSRAGAADACDLCNGVVRERTAFLIQNQAELVQACCPHCGFLLLDDLDDVTSVLARDFLYGRAINALEAVYLLESDVRLCCVPNILSFADRSDALRFQHGFNGRIASFAEARDFLRQRHSGLHGG